MLKAHTITLVVMPRNSKRRELSLKLQQRIVVHVSPTYRESYPRSSGQYQKNIIVGPMVFPGRYRHYKGQEYEVLGIAKHCDTEKEYVVYRALYGKRELWIRLLVVFQQHVNVKGRRVPRFTRLPAHQPMTTDC